MESPPDLARRSSALKSSKPFNPKTLSESFRSKQPATEEETAARTESFREARRQAFAEANKRNASYFVKNDLKTTLEELATDPVVGLTAAEAARRLEINGPNEMEKDPPEPMWKMFLHQFEDLLVILLIVACILSFILGEYTAAVTIVIIVMANATLGVVQEARAGAALEALHKLTSPITTVIRDGKKIDVDSVILVPGDIVILENGCSISADIRLIETNDMLSNEMALTGEAEAVKKSPVRKEDEGKKDKETLTERHMVYTGCTVDQGTGKGVVVKTGMETKMGDIARNIASAEPEDSPLQKKLHKLGVQLGMASIFISLVVLVVGITTGRGGHHGSDQPHWLQMILVAVSLTVAAVPEGLPTCVTITLAIGMQRMTERKALIRNLHSVETLGSATVICTDKTGTLTAGAMTAVRMWFADTVITITGEGYDPKGYFVPENADVSRAEQLKLAPGAWQLVPLVALLCSDATLEFNKEENRWDAKGNSSERPLVVAAAKAALDKAAVDKQYDRIREATNPFNSDRKMMSTLVTVPKETIPAFKGLHLVACIKGAPDRVFDKCVAIATADGKTRKFTPKDKENLLAQVDRFSERAYRVLAIAYQPLDDHPGLTGPEVLEKNLVLAGLFASIDPERQAVAPSIRKAADAGIRTVMITGDYAKTAKAIAENINLLPPNSPDAKAIDCSIIRALTAEANKIIDAGRGGDKKKPSPELQAVYDRIDAITAYADVYARAQPTDKSAILRSLQRQGNVCSMTGDGVNDAIALKQADIGVAMGKTGTDVARAASDMVLTDDNFVSIVDAIEQGRTIYVNIGKFVFYLLSTNVSEVLSILICVLLGYPSPLVPVQILWLNLCTDGAPAIALAIERTEPDIMTDGPRPLTENLIEKVMITGIVIQNICLTTTVCMTYIIGIYWQTGYWDFQAATDTHSIEFLDEAVKHATTMCILHIVFGELLRAYSARSLRNSVFSIGIFSNKWMQVAVGTAWVGTAIVTQVPGLMGIFETVHLTEREYAWVVIASFIPFTVDEITKFFYRLFKFGLRAKAVRPSNNQVPEELRLLNQDSDRTANV